MLPMGLFFSPWWAGYHNIYYHTTSWEFTILFQVVYEVLLLNVREQIFYIDINQNKDLNRLNAETDEIPSIS